MDALNARCDLLRSLHVRGRPLVLPNAWDAASARAVVAAGFPVVATTSAGVADALGYDDHEAAPAEEMLAAAARIARAVDVPVTVDAEAGYGLDADALVEALAEAGAAGCNLEDTDHATEILRSAADATERIAAVRAAADDRGYCLAVNARVDVFLLDHDRPQAELVEEAAARGRAYLDAGADCVYPIVLREEAALAEFLRAVDGSVNILAMNAPPLPRLAELGVARVSYGAYLQRRSIRQLAVSLGDLGG